MTKLRLRNTLTRKVADFAPLDPANVRMYVCGPTVYDRAHLGNARPVVVFDVLFRLLRHVYGEGAVTYVRNFTDVDDKINAKAAETGRPIRDITDETIGWYHADMDALGALRPTFEPRATDYIPQMVAMIEGLVASGHAYAVEGHVLFRVRSYAAYGALSGRSVDDMIAGARVEVAPFKEDPMDFVLWKPSAGDVPGWDSPWGYGRPGWHIECSAMADGLLWDGMKDRLSPAALAVPHVFDIHGGGIDLQFPHHENEIAQSCCSHGAVDPAKGFARYWMHNEMLLVEGRKMSKSLGNFFTVRDLLDGTNGAAKADPMAIRIALLLSHYRSAMDYSANRRHEAFVKWLAIGQIVADGLDRFGRPLTQGVPYPEVVAFLADDLNTRPAINLLVDRAKRGIESFTDAEFSIFLASGDLLGLDQLASEDIAVFRKLGAFKSSFSNSNEAENAAILDIENAIDEARKAKDYKTSDQLRAEVNKLGIEVQTSEGKTFLVRQPGYLIEGLLSLARNLR